MIIYIDADCKCHIAPAEGLIPVETKHFENMCQEYIEGNRFVPAGQTWTREDGIEFSGEMFAPWRDWDELDDAQRKYEREQLAEAQAALAILGVNA